MSSIIIESQSAEPVDVEIRAASDPSGTDPQFQVTATSETSPDSGDWEDGSWVGSYDTTTKKITARTPTIGLTGTATLELTEGSTYKLWIKWGSVVKLADTVKAT